MDDEAFDVEEEKRRKRIELEIWGLWRLAKTVSRMGREIRVLQIRRAIVLLPTYNEGAENVDGGLKIYL